MFRLHILLILLQFVHFPLLINGTGTAGPSSSSGAGGVGHKVNEKEEHNFIISIAVKNFDGGIVTFQWKNDPEGKKFFHRAKYVKSAEEKEYFKEKMEKFPHLRDSNAQGIGYGITDILKIYYGIETTYVPTTLPHFEEGASLKFKHDVTYKELGIRARHEDHVAIKEGEARTIWDVVHLLANDGLWGIMVGQYDESKVLFQCHFNGHVMVALALPQFDQNGNEIAPKEVARFHTNMFGLNYFVNKQNFVVEKGKNDSQRELKVTRWGTYIKEEFTPRLFTRKISIGEMKRIALDLLEKYGQWHSHDYSCRHFVYTFVNEIKMENVDLSKFESWPPYFRRLDVHNRDKLHHTFCFDILKEAQKEKEDVKMGFSGHVKGHVSGAKKR